MKKNIKFILVLTCAVILQIAFDINAMAPTNERRYSNFDDEGIALLPQPVTIDRVIHNIGNIAVNIDNWGYVGGYNYWLPSGEFPRGSGHDYLAEILYWMGAVTASGDTIVANTMDDFQGIPMPVDGNNEYVIYFSTDTTRYYDYDLTDTVGLATGRPAYGWRIWDSENEVYDLNTSYNSLAASFNPSGPTSQQDSHYRFNDASSGSSVLGLEITQTVYQWNYCYNEDFMFYQLDITNTSTEDYAEFAFGLYVDIDVGGDDGEGGNGRLQDMVSYDTTLNYAYIYDVLNYDPGWDTATGVMGTVMLETPGDVGMTALRTDDWSYFPSTDEERFAMINSTQYDTPLPPTDQFYVQCVRGINLAAGTTVRVVYAMVAGEDEESFIDNVAMAQELYDSYFVGPEPPNLPSLTVRPGDGKVYLSWNDTAEVSIDPMSGENDFAGYKIYRSDNLGRTWGTVNYKNDNNCLGLDYYPLATYKVITPGDPVPHSFVDEGLYNGVEYWYCIAAYDQGDTLTGVDALQSGFGIANQVANIVAVTPRSNPAGYYEASTTVEHVYNGTETPSDGNIVPIIFDEDKLTGSDYEVVFEDSPAALYWHLLNTTTGDTVLANQTVFNNDIEDAELAEGLQVLVTNAENVPKNYGQTGFAGADTTLAIVSFDGPSIVYWTGNESYAFAPSQYRPIYELRYTVDSSVAVSMWEGFDGVPYPTTMIPFEVWNTYTNQRVTLVTDDWPVDGVWDVHEALIIVDIPYDPLGDVTGTAFPYYYGWRFVLDDAVYAPVVGDVLTIEGSGANSPDDKFVFKTGGISTAAAAQQLQNIKVVPNPYLVKYSSLVETTEDRSKLYFNNLPDICTLRIYTLAGDLIKTIEHNSGDGSEAWDLLAEGNNQVSSGIYMYHVESEYGEFLGRFAIVK